MKKIAIVILALVGVATVAQAQIVVSWNGTNNNVVTGNQNITKTNSFTISSGYQSPATGANYGNVTSPNFYAAMSDTAPAFTLFDGAQNDLVGRIQAGGTAAGTFSAMLAWEVASTDTLDIMRIGGWGSFGANVTSSSMRFLFQDSVGDWYASNPNSLQTFGASVSSMSWYDFTPHTSGTATIGSLASGLDFSDVQMVGLYEEFTTTGGGGVFSTLFEATVTPVPEPTAAALLALGAAALLCHQRRKSPKTTATR